jgi:S-adenosylmethionine-diacylgycerolhomoserine-N-methlytransferase
LSVSSEALPAQELMDRVYRHQRHIYDATRKYFLLGRDHLIASLDPPAGGHVLELGCGTGRNLIGAARQYPQARLYGVDISAAMLATARKNVAAAGLHDRIVLGQGDATRLEPATAFGLQRFERVFFSYSLSMIPPWRQALAHGAALVAPGGRLSLVDFGQQDDLPPWFRTLLFAWLRRFHVHPPADLADAVASTATDLNAHRAFARLSRGYACYAEISLPAADEASFRITNNLSH